VNRSAPARAAMESVLGLERTAWRPEFAPQKFRAKARSNPKRPVHDGERTPGRVAIFATCYVNYNEPGIGHDLIAILEHNEIPYMLIEKEACCGMPKLEIGDLESVEQLKNINIPQLAQLAREGYAIVTSIPSCTLMYKQELPLMFPDDADVQAVRQAMWDPFEYLVARHKDGLLKRTSGSRSARLYHVPSTPGAEHRRKTEEMLKLLPQTKVNTVERCSGHSGIWGTRKEFHAMAMKIGRRCSRAWPAPARLHQFGLPARRPSHRAGHRAPRRRGTGRQAARVAHPSRSCALRTASREKGSPELHMAHSRDSLLSLEAYAKSRKEFAPG